MLCHSVSAIHMQKYVAKFSWKSEQVLISAVFYSLNAPSTLEWGSQMPWYTNTRQLLGTELDGTMPSHLINIFNISLAALAIVRSLPCIQGAT